jgi:hypothetical protein
MFTKSNGPFLTFFGLQIKTVEEVVAAEVGLDEFGGSAEFVARIRRPIGVVIGTGNDSEMQFASDNSSLSATLKIFLLI